MANNAGHQAKAEIKEAIDQFGKLYRGILALGKEVLPEDTARFAKMAAEPLEHIRDVAVAMKDAMTDKPPKSLVKVREHCRKRGALDGADAQALEHALTLTEKERDAANERFRAHNKDLLKMLSKGAKVDVEVLLAHIKKGLR